MISESMAKLVRSIRDVIHPLHGETNDFYPLLDLVGDSHFVLLGEETHGTHQFYQARAELTRLLIEEKGFNAVAVEADFPDAYYVNQFIKGDSLPSASQTLQHFSRFPNWMWCNEEMLYFVNILRSINDNRVPERKVGFYGLDLYSMYSSIESVIAYLQKVDPEAAINAKRRFECFERFGSEDDSYERAMKFYKPDCRDEVVSQLQELQQKELSYIVKNNINEKEAFFTAKQNARLAMDAEQYYREMFNKKVNSWNLRDLHMTNTIDQISEYLLKTTGYGKVIVWAHNSHIGNAMATEFARTGELNIGQLMLYRHWDDVKLIGFTTHSGTLSAASDWGGNVQTMQLNPSIPGSYEDLFHNTDIKAFIVDLHNIKDTSAFFESDHLERAIGVTYSPQSERESHYFFAKITDQFDAIVHYDISSALTPL